MEFFPPVKGQNIYLEANGERLGVVESYRCRTVRENRNVSEIGASEAVASVGGTLFHYIELTRVLLTGDFGDGVDFYQLSDFNLVIVKPTCRIIYSGCEWTDVLETGSIRESVIEKVTITAVKRRRLG